MDPNDRMNPNMPVQLFLDPNDRMNPNVPVQLFLNDPPRSSKKRERQRSVEIEPAPSNDFDLKSRISPDRDWMYKGDKKRPKQKKGDGRFSRIPELVICNRTKRTLASTICDLQTHFLRTAANIVVYRFSNYGREDPNNAYVDKRFQGAVPYKFCTIREVRDYIDTSMYGIRDELRPQKVESVCFAIVNDLEESLLEVTVDIFQTKNFYNRRIKAGNSMKPVRELRTQLCKALFQLQELRIKPRMHRKLLRTRTSLTIRYATIDAGEEEDDEDSPDGWEPIFPTPLDWAVLHPWTEPIVTEFNQLQFHVMTDS